MNDTILIIANGPSALKNEYGAMVNDFPEVARINNYKIYGHENHIGSKTTIWFNGANRKLKIRKNIPNKVIVFVPAEILMEKEYDVIERTPGRLNLNKSQYQLIDKETMTSYEVKSNIKRPTTGLNSIIWSIENYRNVIIHGFDFFIESRHHYYDSYLIKKIVDLGITGRSKKHDNIAEKEYVEKLLDTKNIITLSDFLSK